MAMHTKSTAGHCTSACDDGWKGGSGGEQSWAVPACLICVHAYLLIIYTLVRGDGMEVDGQYHF
ncbi:hypothetical protein Nmel_001808 [Mimus melanotis]